jgi:hypothetical protein
MIQITFTPETPQQVAALTQAMVAYLKATPQASSAAQELVEHPDLPVVVAAGMDAEAPKAVARKLKKPEAPAAETPAPAAEAPAVTLEQVRAKLTELSQSGKKDDIKVLIAKFGGTKLTDLKAEQYADVLAAAEAL